MTSNAMRLSAALMSLAMAVALTGCPEVVLPTGPATPECTVSAECEGGQVCGGGGTCQLCGADIQCEAEYGNGWTCSEAGGCVEPTTPPCPEGTEDCPCGVGESCADSLECRDGLCQEPVVPPCPEGTLDCPCGASATCNEGLECTDGTCREPIVPPCPVGTLTCPCDAGDACSDGFCVDGTCVDCVRGDEGCACYPNDTCNAGLECDTANGVCISCPAGSDGCACDAGECGSGLLCIDDTCAQDTCVDGAEGCPCNSDATCDAGLACVDSLCEPCTNAIEGCPCDDDDICVDLVCDPDDTLCRPSVACVVAECGPNQLCEEPQALTEDALCLEACETGFMWDINTDACVPNTDANCDPGAAGSILATCDAQNRACDASGMPAQCGPCKDFFVDDGGTLQICRPVLTCVDQGCAALNRTCTAETATTDAFCGGCLEFFVDDDGTLTECRAVLTCDGQGCAAANRVCTAETATSDAACQECLSGFTDEGGTLTECRAWLTCLDVDCAALNRDCLDTDGQTFDASCSSCSAGFVEKEGLCVVPDTCIADVPGSILAQCDAEFRVCNEPLGEGGSCGECITDYSEDPATGLCVPNTSCIDLDCAGKSRVCLGDFPFQSCGDCLDGTLESPLDPEFCIPPLSCGNHPAAVATTAEPAGAGNCAGNGWRVDAGGDSDFDDTLDPVEVAQTGYICDDSGTLLTVVTSLGPGAECTYGGWRVDAGLDIADGGGVADDGVLAIGEIDLTLSVCNGPDTLTCSPDDFCVEGDGVSTNAVCATAQCGQGLAYSEWTGQCETCTVTCGDTEGETGRIWPFTLQGSTECICESEQGYYWDEGGTRETRPCDADGDGWTRDAARTYINSTDPAVKQNARCQLRVIDRFVLQNELGQRQEVQICAGDTTFVLDDGVSPCANTTIPLYETLRNDDANELASVGSLAPAYSYSGVGRQLRPSEVNPLTRACLQGADYNDNNVTDIREWHGIAESDFPNPSNDIFIQEKWILSNFSFYTELHRSWYENGPSSTLVGQYVIAERSRCELGFPMTYGPSTTSDYWKECTRNRDTSFDPTDGSVSPDFTYDFARWNCDATSGTCPQPPPPTDAVPGTDPPEHGLCQVSPLPPQDDECVGTNTDPWRCTNGGVWRGMNHHSQFKCVVVDDTASIVEPHLPVASFYVAEPGESEPPYVFNKCNVDCPTGDDTCAVDCAGDKCVDSTEAPAAFYTPYSPVYSCQQNAAPVTGDVGWAVATYVASGGAYKRGCINEWAPKTISGDPNGSEDDEVYPWRALCPGYMALPDAVIGQSNQFDFGRLQCGCGNNYGGPQCNVGCSPNNLHIGGVGAGVDYQATPRVGFWMCGSTSVTDWTGLDPTFGPTQTAANSAGTQWAVNAEVPADGMHAPQMCETTRCSSLGIDGTTFGAPNTCGASPECSVGAEIFANAADRCSAAGMRLCSLAELTGDEARGTGCSFDSARIWSSTRCGPDSYWTTGGATTGGLSAECTAASDAGSATTRCCASGCTSTGWTIRR